MRALRNPILLALLLLVAAALVVYQVKPRPKPSARAKSSANAPAAAAKQGASMQTNALALAKVRPDRPVEIEYVRQRAKTWVEAPLRDPFLAYAMPRQSTRQTTNAPVTFILTAIWRQSGSALAVINGTVCGEGDNLAGFRVERIENDQVLLENADGRELVRFPLLPEERPEQEGEENTRAPKAPDVSVVRR